MMKTQEIHRGNSEHWSQWYMAQEYVYDIAASEKSEIGVFLRFLLLLVICGVCRKRTKATAKPKMQ